MDAFANTVEEAILSRQAMGVVMILTIAAALLTNRGFVREVWHDTSRFWRVIARLAAVTGGATLLWVGMLDDWLQLVAEPYRLSRKWDYQRVVYDPISDNIRTVSVVLIVVSLLFLAMLFARHVGAYLMQIGTMLIGLLLWVPLYIMNQRMNIMLAEGAASSEGPLQTLGITVFWVLRSVLGVATVVVTLIPVMMVMALIVTLLLDLFKMREPPVTKEADGFFSELGRRAGSHEDVPLSRFWKPFRQPL